VQLLEPGDVALDVVAPSGRLDYAGGKDSVAEGAPGADLLEAAGEREQDHQPQNFHSSAAADRAALTWRQPK